MITQKQPNILELTIPAYHTLLHQGKTSCSEVIRIYLARIAQHDPTLKTLVTINPNALATAIEKDTEIKHRVQNGLPLQHLHGVPIILKDNYTTSNLPTSAGTKALQSLHSKDSEVVTHLLKAGAIILAKANLHEFALHGTTTSSLGGQTLNPYDLSRTPGGSSGGTAAALAANLGLVGCGTDTMNSLRSPASACSIVGFRPSMGSVSCVGIVPVSETQDIAGPMGRTVGDVRILYEVMTGSSKGSIGSSSYFGSFCREQQQQQRAPRIGLLKAYFELDDAIACSEQVIAENSTVQRVVRNALNTIQGELDIILVPVDSGSNWTLADLLANADTQPFEFRDCLDSFLQSQHVSSTPYSSLQAISHSGEYDKEAVTEVFYASLLDPAVYSRTSKEYRSRLDNIATLKESVRRCFDKYELDVLVYPHQRQLVVNAGETRQPNRNGVLAAVTGNPAICIPAGFSPATASAPRGVPIGIELMGRHGNDDELLNIAAQLEQVLQARKTPLLNESG
ncbi:Amidase [Penicillium sp. IBT 35674x]|nr:Amidase [Penicillium sp. IBT 35674x]